MCFVKKVLLKILQYLQKSTCAGVSLQAFKPVTLFKKLEIEIFSYEHCEIFKKTYFG